MLPKESVYSNYFSLNLFQYPELKMVNLNNKSY